MLVKVLNCNLGINTKVFLNGNLSNVAAIFPSPTYLSGDNKVILLAANRHSVYRHSGLFDYYLYNISTM